MFTGNFKQTYMFVYDLRQTVNAGSRAVDAMARRNRRDVNCRSRRAERQ